MTRSFARTTFRCLLRAAVKMNDEGGLAVASNVALSLLLSLFPFLMLVASLVRLCGDPSLAASVIDLLLGHWPADSAEPIQRTVEKLLSQPPDEFFSIGTVIALILASNGIENARDGLNRAYDVRESRSFYWRRLQGAFFVLIGALGLILASIVLIATPLVWTFLASQLDWLQQFSFVVTGVQYGLAVSILALVLFCFHHFLPDWAGKKHNIHIGLAFTICGILIGSKLFGLYLQNVANYTAIYAGLAGMMIAIVYLYCLSVLILYGAELNAAIAEEQTDEKNAR